VGGQLSWLSAVRGSADLIGSSAERVKRCAWDQLSGGKLIVSQLIP
jgi:hypothetical protein